MKQIRSSLGHLSVPALSLLGALLCAPSPARADIDPACEGQVPDPYIEEAQRDFLLNYFALSATLSPLHGPVPHAPGRGAVGVDVGLIPEVACEQRFALGATKTEDTSVLPVFPRPRITFALGTAGGRVVYGGLGWVPPINVADQRSQVVSIEAGVGGWATDTVQVGLRFHATSQKTLYDAATAFESDAPAATDVFVGHTFGLDVLAARPIGNFVPYAAVGFTDVSTFFWIGDDGVISNNLHPYAGPVFSAGADVLLGDRLRLAGEVYAAPGGYSRPDPNYDRVPGVNYGRLTTARMKVAWEFGGGGG